MAMNEDSDSDGEVVDVKTMVTLRAANGDEWEAEAASWYKGDYAIDVAKFQSKAVFEKVSEYIDMHNKFRDLAVWDHNFLDGVDTDTLYYLIRAARLLKQDGLLQLIYQRMADIIKGRTIEEIHTIFNIKTGLTLEQERQIQQKNVQMLKPKNPAGGHQEANPPAEGDNDPMVVE